MWLGRPKRRPRRRRSRRRRPPRRRPSLRRAGRQAGREAGRQAGREARVQSPREVVEGQIVELEAAPKETAPEKPIWVYRNHYEFTGPTVALDRARQW